MLFCADVLYISNLLACRCPQCKKYFLIILQYFDTYPFIKSITKALIGVKTNDFLLKMKVSI